MQTVEHPNPAELRAFRKSAGIFIGGAIAGYLLYGVQTQNSEVRKAEEAALAACAQMRVCLERAQRFTPDFADVGSLIVRP